MKESQIERTNRWLPDENRQINEGPCGTDFQLKVSESQVWKAVWGIRLYIGSLYGNGG